MSDADVQALVGMVGGIDARLDRMEFNMEGLRTAYRDLNTLMNTILSMLARCPPDCPHRLDTGVFKVVGGGDKPGGS